MVERRHPENRHLRQRVDVLKAWITVRDYADIYAVDPRTVRKWAEAGLVELIKVALPGKRPIVRVSNCPPRDHAVNTSHP